MEAVGAVVTVWSVVEIVASRVKACRRAWDNLHTQKALLAQIPDRVQAVAERVERLARHPACVTFARMHQDRLIKALTDAETLLREHCTLPAITDSLVKPEPLRGFPAETDTSNSTVCGRNSAGALPVESTLFARPKLRSNAVQRLKDILSEIDTAENNLTMGALIDMQIEQLSMMPPRTPLSPAENDWRKIIPFEPPDAHDPCATVTEQSQSGRKYPTSEELCDELITPAECSASGKVEERHNSVLLPSILAFPPGHPVCRIYSAMQNGCPGNTALPKSPCGIWLPDVALRMGYCFEFGEQGCERQLQVALWYYLVALFYCDFSAGARLKNLAKRAESEERDSKTIQNAFSEAVAVCEQKRDSPSHMTSLAICLHYGIGTGQDKNNSQRLLRDSVRRHNFLPAMAILGRSRTGQEDIRDKKEAADWCKTAADNGHPVAQSHLYQRYKAGARICTESEAIKHLRNAVGAGVPRALLLAAKNNVLGDPASLVRKAAEMGYAGAQLELARYLRVGLRGLGKNHLEATLWLERAKVQGCRRAGKDLKDLSNSKC